MEREHNFMAILALPIAEALPQIPEEELVTDLVRNLHLEDAAWGEILGRLLVVDAQHPELEIRRSLQTLHARVQGGADSTEDLQAIVRMARPFLER